MAVTGKFSADFQSFFDAAQKAEVVLRPIEAGAEKVEKSLNRMANSFSGQKIIQDATLATEAVNRIGGATTLTEKEQAKLNRTVTEAIEKYGALGQKAPADMIALAEATKKVEPPMSKASGAADMLKTAMGAVGLSFSVGAVLSFGKSIFDAASNVHDMAEKLGVSAEAAQGFKFAAEQSGTTLDAVGTSINKMNLLLGQGQQSTVEALNAAGLSFQEIRAMRPEDAFLAITDAIQKIPDPMEQVRIGTALMGKGFSDLLPAIREGFRGAADGAAKMSEDTVNSLEAAQDAWGKLANAVTIATGTMIAHTISWTSQATSSIKSFTTFASDAASKGVGYAISMQLAAGQGAAAIASAGKAASDQFERETTKTVKVHEELTDAQKKAAAAAEAFRRSQDVLFGRDMIARANDYLKQLGPLSNLSKLSADKQSELNKAAGDAWRAYALLGQVAPKAIQDLYDRTVDVTTLTPKVVSMAVAFQGIKIGTAVAIPTMDAFIGTINGLPKDTFRILGDSITMVPPKIEKVKNSLDSLVGSLAQLAQIGGGNSAFSGLVSGLGGILGGISSGGKGLDAFKDVKGSMTSHIAGLVTMASGYGAVAMAAIAAGKAVFKAMNDGRKAVEDFAKSQGGFDALHASMSILGDDSERLWIKLTQQTKKGDQKGAQAVIDEITAALERQRAKTAEVDAATTAAAEKQAAAIEAISGKYTEQLSKLDSEYKSLSDSVGAEADELEMGVQETRDRARMAQIELDKAAIEEKKAAEIAASTDNYDKQIEDAKTANDKIREIFRDPMRIPVVFEYPGGGTSAPSTSGTGTYSGASSATRGGARGGATNAVQVTTVLNIDGREAARSIAPHIPAFVFANGH